MENRAHEMKILTRAKNNSQGIPVVRTPQFPGLAGQDLSIEQVRAIIRRQKKARGFRFPLVTGVNAPLQIPISGDARTFLGFAVLFENIIAPATIPSQMTLTLNDEILINQVPPAFFTPDFMDDEYYFFPRPLSGQDDITISITQPGGGTQDFILIVYYI